MPKRKAELESDAPHASSRRSSRNKTNEDNVKSEEQSTTPSLGSKAKVRRLETNKQTMEESVKAEMKTEVPSEAKPVAKPKEKAGAKVVSASASEERQYWLMKAEPETRIERGHDISFSIDDLASLASPEPWDGIRNYAARNNLRSMKKGDLAFFYHSSCKVPAVVGIMEIVEEHSPDLTAQDPKKPYYDPKDTDPSNPKWSVVHVEFRRKFAHPVTLSELKEMVKGGNKVLANMDLLGKGRLSVGKVSKKEWDFIMDLVDRKDKEELGGSDVQK